LPYAINENEADPAISYTKYSGCKLWLRDSTGDIVKEISADMTDNNESTTFTIDPPVNAFFVKFNCDTGSGQVGDGDAITERVQFTEVEVYAVTDEYC
jgi:hypothetical protein